MVLQNTDTDRLQDSNSAQQGIFITCSSIMVICIVLIVGCGVCISKRKPKPAHQTPQRVEGYNAVVLSPDSLTDNDGYELPVESRQGSLHDQERRQTSRCSQNNKETVCITNLGAMTKISISCEKLDSSNSWSNNPNHSSLNTEFISIFHNGTLKKVTNENKNSNEKSSSATDKSQQSTGEIKLMNKRKSHYQNAAIWKLT